MIVSIYLLQCWVAHIYTVVRIYKNFGAVKYDMSYVFKYKISHFLKELLTST